MEVLRLLSGCPSVKIVLLENVRGLLSPTHAKDLKFLLESLVHLGFEVAWTVVEAANVGLPQRRRRIFILGTQMGGLTKLKSKVPKVSLFGLNSD